jgi:hypothetical protein
MHRTPITRLRFRVAILWAALLLTLRSALSTARRNFAQALQLQPMAGGSGDDEDDDEGDKGKKGSKDDEDDEDDDEEDTPPWGSDEDFKPEKAWNLIKRLRKDKDKLKTRAEEAEGKVKKHEDENKTEAERKEAAQKEAETKAEKAELKAARLQVALDKGLTKSQAKRLVGSNEEELAADADELLADLGGGKNDDEDDDDDGDQGSRAGRRPAERPGAAPKAKPEENDPAKLAAEVPRGF